MAMECLLRPAKTDEETKRHLERKKQNKIKAPWRLRLRGKGGWQQPNTETWNKLDTRTKLSSKK